MQGDQGRGSRHLPGPGLLYKEFKSRGGSGLENV